MIDGVAALWLVTAQAAEMAGPTGAAAASAAQPCAPDDTACPEGDGAPVTENPARAEAESLAADETLAEDIVVTARRVSTPFAPQTVDQLEILTDPSANADALLAVAALPASTSLDNSADIQLRGGAIGLSRVYFNDVPLYEAVRGSAIDQVTRVASIFNANIVSNVEVYPTNPPPFLPNSAAGAVRILPVESAALPTTLFVGLPGSSFATSIATRGGGVINAYATAANLDALLELNPGLRDTTTRFRSVSLGGAGTLPVGDGGELAFLSVVDAEDGRYPLRLLELSGPSDSLRRRVYGVASLELPLAAERLKLDFAYTDIRNRLTYLDFDAIARNRYVYAAADMAGRVGRVDYRFGVAGERIIQRTRGSLAFFDGGGGSPSRGQVRRTAGYASIYGYAAWSLAADTLLSVGTRQFFGDSPSQQPVLMAGLSWSSADRTHRVIVSAGRYSALVPAEIGTLAAVRPAQSRQLSIDYAFRGPGVTLDTGFYLKNDRIDGSDVDIVGADASLNLRLAPTLDLTLMAATSRQRDATNARAAQDLPYLLRATVRWSLSRTALLNVRLTSRSGAVYSRLDGVSVTPDGPFPLFATRPNTERLPDFRVLDVTLLELFQQWPGATKPFVFATINNALDRRNPSRVVFTPGYQRAEFSFFEPRSFTFGLVFQL